MIELHQFITDFQDHLAPKLDTYEQALYLYIFRHSRFVDKDEVVIGFKSARKRMAVGIMEGKPMAEGTAYEKLRSLAKKGCIEIIASERTGQRMRLKLPAEIPGVIVAPQHTEATVDLDSMDFFSVTDNRARILVRENHRCFY